MKYKYSIIGTISALTAGYLTSRLTLDLSSNNILLVVIIILLLLSTFLFDKKHKKYKMQLEEADNNSDITEEVK